MLYRLTDVSVKKVARETRNLPEVYHITGKADGADVVLAARFNDIEVAEAYARLLNAEPVAMGFLWWMHDPSSAHPLLRRKPMVDGAREIRQRFEPVLAGYWQGHFASQIREVNQSVNQKQNLTSV